MSLILNGSDTSAGDDAGLGYTSAEGLILTGQGTTSDVTIKNDADATVISIPTGSNHVGIGTTSPATELEIYNAGFTAAQITSNSSAETQLRFATNTAARISNQANTSLIFDTNATERVRILNDGKVGIGTTAPGAMLQVHSAALGTTAGNTQDILQLHSPDTSNNTVYKFLNYRHTNGSSHDQSELRWQRKVDVTNHGYIGLRVDAITFGYGDNTERMRMLNDGNFIVAGTSFNANGSVCIGPIGTSSNGCTAVSASTSATNIWRFYNPNGHIGSISLSGSTCSFTNLSDYRLKENVNYTFDATTRLKQLKPARFNFISDDTNTLVDGFIAHEVSSVVPEAITGAKDAVDENGDAVYQGIDQSKLVPLLVKTIQELEARITALEAG